MQKICPFTVNRDNNIQYYVQLVPRIWTLIRIGSKKVVGGSEFGSRSPHKKTAIRVKLKGCRLLLELGRPS
jgi:hypothetical protein